MLRKIEWGLVVLYNILRLPIISLFNKGRIKYKYYTIISPNAKIATSSNGKINIGNKNLIENGSVMRATGGEINTGKNIYINRNCNIISRCSISIGDNVTIGPNVSIYDHDHDFKNKNGKYYAKPIIIGENVWIGANVIILKGVTIGANSVIGAGSIITKDIPKSTVVTTKHEIYMRGI